MSKFNKDWASLRTEKRSTTISAEEEAIGVKEAVRKGRDLEDIILHKFSTLHGCAVPTKPKHMYEITDFPYLTVNFDGVIQEGDFYIPAEAKFVTSYGEKYYNRSLSIEREFPPDTSTPPAPAVIFSNNDIAEYCIAKAKSIGIPAYYYVQVQHQMIALGSPYGYLVALHDKGWETCIYKIPRSEEVTHAIKVEGYKFWQTVIPPELG